MPYQYGHLNDTIDFRDMHNMTNAIKVFIIRNTHSILRIKYTQREMKEFLKSN
jgi:hypothetical protein